MVSRWLYRFYAFEQVSRVDAGDPDFIYRDAFIAWWISARATPVLLQVSTPHSCATGSPMSRFRSSNFFLHCFCRGGSSVCSVLCCGLRLAYAR
jgi:hypothetical protein